MLTETIGLLARAQSPRFTVTFRGSMLKGILSAMTPRSLEIPIRSLEVLRQEVIAATGQVLDVGCGARQLGEGVIRTDIVPFVGLDVISDACRLPFRDGHFSLVVCSEVLEHVPNWEQARDEIVRVTRPGGYVFVDVPFLYPYHASPEQSGHDYTRWTPRGLGYMFRDFEIVKEGLTVGHGSMLAVLLREFIARCFLTSNHTGPYYLISGWLSWILYPLTWLDRWLDRKPRAHVIGGAYYILARKPGQPSTTPASM